MKIRDLTVLAQMVEYFKRQENRAEVLEIANDIVLQRFQKFNPPKFSREANVKMAEKWIEVMEDIYDALKYSDERKITFGKFQFEGPGKEWWSVSELREDPVCGVLSLRSLGKNLYLE